MAEMGILNQLKVVKQVEFGLYLDGGQDGEILLPKRYVPDNTKPGDMLEVFIYRDSEDRIIATTEKPFAMAGQFAYLKVVSVAPFGAFLDWGLEKDLLVPLSEQKLKMEAGNSYVVFVYTDDETNRVVASAKLDRFLDPEPAEYVENEEVDLLIVGSTELGYKAIINDSHQGVLYKNEVFRPLQRGTIIKGYIKKLREDGKIDLSLDKPGYEKIDDLQHVVLDKLSANAGVLPLGDKSPSEEIYKTFGVSKKTFKKAIGALYKAKLITLGDNEVKLIVK